MAERTGPKGSQKSLMMLLSMRRTWCALAPEAMGMWRHRADCMQADRGDGGGGGGVSGLKASGHSLHLNRMLKFSKPLSTTVGLKRCSWGCGQAGPGGRLGGDGGAGSHLRCSEHAPPAPLPTCSSHLMQPPFP